MGLRGHCRHVEDRLRGRWLHIHVQCACRDREVHSRGRFGAHSGDVKCTFRERSVHIKGTSSAHSESVQCTFREHSENLPARGNTSINV